MVSKNHLFRFDKKVKNCNTMFYGGIMKMPRAFQFDTNFYWSPFDMFSIGFAVSLYFFDVYFTYHWEEIPEDKIDRYTVVKEDRVWKIQVGKKEWKQSKNGWTSTPG
jgi:hypothetical protein